MYVLVIDRIIIISQVKTLNLGVLVREYKERDELYVMDKIWEKIKLVGLEVGKAAANFSQEHHELKT